MITSEIYILDFLLVKNVSHQSGGNALQVHIDDEAYVDFENFYFNISSPVLKNVQLHFNCKAALSNITIGMGNAFYNDVDNFIVGKQTKGTIELKISGMSANGPYTDTIRIPPLQLNQVIGVL